MDIKRPRVGRLFLEINMCLRSDIREHFDRCKCEARAKTISETDFSKAKPIEVKKTEATGRRHYANLDAKGNQPRYPFVNMEITDWFYIFCDSREKILSTQKSISWSATMNAKIAGKGMKFRTKRDENGVTCWRDE